MQSNGTIEVGQAVTGFSVSSALCYLPMHIPAYRLALLSISPLASQQLNHDRHLMTYYRDSSQLRINHALWNTQDCTTYSSSSSKHMGVIVHEMTRLGCERRQF